LIIVYCIENSEKDLLDSYISSRNPEQAIALFQRFERKLIIKKVGEIEGFCIDNYIVTEKGMTLLTDCVNNIERIDIIISESIEKIEEKISNSPLDKFVKEFLDIYPQGRNKAGEVLKSNEVDVKARLEAFLRKYKYSKETILKATRNYIQQQSQTQYAYCTAAHYFINKQGFGSKLATECENVITGKNDTSSFIDQLM